MAASGIDRGEALVTAHGARRLAWSAFALWVVFLLTSLALDLATEPLEGAASVGASLVFAAIPLSNAVVAILVLSRHPQNPIGWMLMAIGLLWVLPFESYGGFAYERGLPGADLFLALSGPIWAPPIGIMGTFLLLRFPDGRLLSPAWKKVEWLAVIAISGTVVAILLTTTNFADIGYPRANNPLAHEALQPFARPLFVCLVMLPITMVLSAASLVRRFRRSTGIERLQLKWLTAAAGGVATLFLVGIVGSLGGEWGTETTPTWLAVIQEVTFASFALIPIAIGVAILKYRLYDIDRIINRTLVYGAVTALLIAVYVGAALGLGALVRSVTGQTNSALVIAASTLSVAALFGPARRRIQAFIDRRFYRRKYDAARTLEIFSAKLREQVDLDSLSGELVGVVHATMQPTHVSLWLRSTEERG
jgi:hypothetical protein